ncbi:hypothetical protein [Streptomyces sp. Wh19]|nr:hypothetical protein [Streptomyces sp. Wh19]MDV9194257.1 hypothetical protein [Streptomyces sp. Wh19]
MRVHFTARHGAGTFTEFNLGGRGPQPLKPRSVPRPRPLPKPGTRR